MVTLQTWESQDKYIDVASLCPVQVKELQWNSDSSVLALWLEPLKKEEVEGHSTQQEGQNETAEERSIGVYAHVGVWAIELLKSLD